MKYVRGKFIVEQASLLAVSSLTPKFQIVLQRLDRR
jgi:hypothetical protein